MVPGFCGRRPGGEAAQLRPRAEEQGRGKRPERSGLQQSPGEAIGKQEEKAGRSRQCGATLPLLLLSFVLKSQRSRFILSRMRKHVDSIRLAAREGKRASFSRPPGAQTTNHTRALAPDKQMRATRPRTKRSLRSERSGAAECN